MSYSGLEHHISAIREFSRFYTTRIGVLDEHMLDSEFSLAEARIIYELAQHAPATASEINRTLKVDPGYLSRVIARLHRLGLVDKVPSTHDGRQTMLKLTENGRNAFAELDRRSSKQAEKLLSSLTAAEQIEVARSLNFVRERLGGETARPQAYALRQHRSGDMGWIVHRHGILYAREYGWDVSFEALAAEVAAAFIRNFDPACERCWIAERDDAILGSVLLIKQDEHTAKLRMLYVEPEARGLGIGRKLVDECTRFARLAGYERITLWTNSVLVAARKIYQDAGYRLIKAEPHHSFGKDLVGETWELQL